VTTINALVYILFGDMWCFGEKKRRNALQNPYQCYVLINRRDDQRKLCGVIAGDEFDLATQSH
jgi:hypothetical protein